MQLMDAYLDELIKDAEDGPQKEECAQMMEDLKQGVVGNFQDGNNILQGTIVAGVLDALGILTQEQLGMIFQSAPSGVIMAMGELAIVADDVLLVATQLVKEVINNMRLWWNGEISGERCAKNVLEISAALVGGLLFPLSRKRTKLEQPKVRTKCVSVYPKKAPSRSMT